MKSNKIYLYICMLLLSFSFIGCGSKTTTPTMSNNVTKPVVEHTSPTTDKIIISKITQGETVNGTTKIMYTATNNNKVAVFCDAQLIITDKNKKLLDTKFEVIGDLKVGQTKTVTEYIYITPKDLTYKFQMEDFNHQGNDTWMN
ncbi:hypothetical protein [Clostridium estertheticum]|uniref:Lipoprotein n=1 Tax=Clostridium estertheticum TaxID=238834 RepID=A0AA47EKV1_9CLOT|nr:hypothetical protein [Clostridium estertheticum]MBU3153489.1 hypothetical protein [Clostridium estertheticum]WAG60891.1 hypothetical protein LL038_01165 [Clostridium estertheticum]